MLKIIKLFKMLIIKKLSVNNNKVIYGIYNRSNKKLK